MRSLFPFMALGLVFLTSCNSIPDGQTLLNRTIDFHDPKQQWPQFNKTLDITLEMPDKPDRQSRVTINLPRNYFGLTEQRDSTIIKRTLTDQGCTFSINGEDDLPEAKVREFRGDCERTNMLKNYYTFLYGLPMKLKDPGTIIHPEVKKDTFQGREYLVLEVSYEPETGQDTWLFYINPETYAMEAYQFFHDLKRREGEFILLEGIEQAEGMKIPKNRSWYTNEGQYLGTDKLTAIE